MPIQVTNNPRSSGKHAQTSATNSPRAQKFTEAPVPPQRRISVQAYKFPRVQQHADPPDDLPYMYQNTSSERKEFPRVQKFSETPVSAERRTSVHAYKYPRLQHYSEPQLDSLHEDDPSEHKE